MTQFEKLIARLKQLMKDNPARVLHVTVIVDEKGEPFLWFTEDTVKVEGKKIEV